MGTDHQLTIGKTSEFVRTHLPGIKPTPDIVEACLQTVAQPVSYHYRPTA